MASWAMISERFRALTAAVLAAEDHPRETIEGIENAMIRIGDQVAREFGVQMLARCTEPKPPTDHRRRSSRGSINFAKCDINPRLAGQTPLADSRHLFQLPSVK